MRNVFAICLSILFLALFSMNSHGEEPKEISRIDGAMLQVVVAALPVIQKAGLDLRRYRVLIVKAVDSYSICFEPLDYDANSFGSGNKDIYAIVEIDAHTLNILGTKFLR
jgi:hypothetical protein